MIQCNCRDFRQLNQLVASEQNTHLPLSSTVRDAVAALTANMGAVTRALPIQAHAFWLILGGNDVLLLAPSGTGKTVERKHSIPKRHMMYSVCCAVVCVRRANSAARGGAVEQCRC